ncbi:RAD52 motif-containing protein 1-like isoform X2 [Biomphalaria glabrata]|nr:RAD52 motif-containing protein 1-like isoform X2 [Biomphalaria glabrata]XP_055872061.1 RAD52 motif-containing protein 1-like isoform X2 [Biomphalaria glabrata]
MNGLEIIDFFKPLEDNKNLFIRNIVLSSNIPDQEQVITGPAKSGLTHGYAQDIPVLFSRLHKTFSRYGLLYEVQVLPCQTSKLQENTSDEKSLPQTDIESLCYYAFVKFYSSVSAEKAKSALNLTHFVGTKACKVTFAKRKRTGSEKQVLFISQCFDLANFYLGFNGWSSSIKELKRELTDVCLSSKEDYCCFACTTNIVIHHHGLSVNGKGFSLLKFSSEDPASQIKAHGRCMKQAYQDSIQKAFSKVILVILGNGKVYTDINSSVPEDLEEFQPSYKSVAVTELEVEPELASDEDNLDEENINILSELETVFM